MGSSSPEGVIFVKIPEERHQPFHDWMSPEKAPTYRNLLPPSAHNRESLPAHATPIRVPTKITYQNKANCGYEKLTFPRYRVSSPYYPYNSLSSPVKTKRTYGRKNKIYNSLPLSNVFLKTQKNYSKIEESSFSVEQSLVQNSKLENIPKDSSDLSPEKSDLDTMDNNPRNAFTFSTPMHDSFDDFDLSSDTKPDFLLDKSKPEILLDYSSSPDFSISIEKQDRKGINNTILTIDKPKFDTEDTKMSLFKSNLKKKVFEKESHLRILDIKNWWTGKFLEDSTNMQLMLSKKGFALHKNGELLPQHNYNANEVRSIAYEFDQYGLFYIRLKNRNAKLNGPGTEYLIQINTTSKLKSLRILQYSCPEVDLIELTQDQAQKILSLKNSINLSKKTIFNSSDYLIKSNEPNTDVVEISPHFDLKLNDAGSQTSSKVHSWLSRKDKKIIEKNEPRLIYPPVVLYDDDIERLNDGEFLNDTIIDFYLKYIQNKLFQNNPSKIDESHIFNTFFYKKLVDKDRFGKKGYQDVKKWTSKTKIDVFTKKYVVIPVNESLHWYVAIICNLDTIPRKPQIHDISKNIESNSNDEMFSFFFSKKKKY